MYIETCKKSAENYDCVGSFLFLLCIVLVGIKHVKAERVCGQVMDGEKKWEETNALQSISKICL